MILEALKVNSIRSIKKAEVEFPQTTILFYGDIGSGKSSILKAIEFGLFGAMGDLPATSLLRRGQNKAEVELNFSIDGNHYVIHRELKKEVRNGEIKISQPPGWLIENDVKTSYTTTELRVKILDLLNYSATKYKSTNKKCVDIFRYTVYTPQEEIKAILQSDPEERFEILKDVLEIEKYENSLNNLEKIKTDLSKRLRDLERDIQNIGSPEEEIPQIENKREEKKREIKAKKIEIKSKRDELEKEKNLLVTFQEEHTVFAKKIVDVFSKQESLKEDQKTLEENEKSLEILNKEILEKQKRLKEFPEIKFTSKKSEAELEKELEKLGMEVEIISKELHSNQIKLSNVEKLLKEGRCSLCGQEIHDKKRFDEELKEAREQITQFSKELEENKKKIAKNKDLLEKSRDFEKIAQKKKGILDVIDEQQKYRQNLEETNNKLSAKIEKLKVEITKTLESYELQSIEKSESHENSLKAKITSQKKKVDSTNERITQLEKEQSIHETELKNLDVKLSEAQDALKRKEKLKNKLDYIGSIKTWVVNHFPTLLKDIERTILATSASQFNQYFKEWFRALVEEENIDIQIDPENFQPIIIVNGYESPFDDLSGGERSALSLAYRLALNKVINTKHQDVKTRDLLILDEPTDGFSEQQVNKMQDVFDTLDMKQMIIISHERTLDSFVSQVFNFKKTNHQTHITIE